jgi:hypothetical protein
VFLGNQKRLVLQESRVLGFNLNRYWRGDR